MEFKVTYRFVGEISINANSKMEAISNFNDKVGFSGDDLYENLIHEALITDVREADE